MNAQHNIDTGKGSLAWANAAVLRVKHACNRGRTHVADHVEVSTGFVEWITASGEERGCRDGLRAGQGGLRELVVLYTLWRCLQDFADNLEGREHDRHTQGSPLLTDYIVSSEDTPRVPKWIFCNWLLADDPSRSVRRLGMKPYLSLSRGRYPDESFTAVQRYPQTHCKEDTWDFPARLCAGKGFYPYYNFELKPESLEGWSIGGWWQEEGFCKRGGAVLDDD